MKKGEKKVKQEKGRATAVAAARPSGYGRERRDVPVGDLSPAPWNPRGNITPESVADLAASIRTLCVIEPLVAMTGKDGGATLISGHRRLVAAKLAGLESVPVDILVGVDEEKELRRIKIAANKARRKLAEWCETNLAGVIAANYTVDVQVALAFQKVFGIGCEWRVFGSQTNTEDAARAYLLDPGAQDFAPMERWASLAAAEIAAKMVKPEIGARYAQLLIAILPPAAGALTDEERQLVASDEMVLKLRESVKVRWASTPTDDEAGDEETED